MKERHFTSEKEEFQIYKLKEKFMKKRFSKSKQGTRIDLFLKKGYIAGSLSFGFLQVKNTMKDR